MSAADGSSVTSERANSVKRSAREVATEFLRVVLPELGEGEEYRCEAWPTPPRFQRAFDTVEGLAGYVTRHGATSNVYFSPCAFRSGRGRKKEAAARCRVVWSDLDCGPEKSFATREDALARLREFPLTARLIVSSGRGLHVYWLLACDVTSGDLDRFRAIVRGLASKLGGDTAACHKTQLLRIPGTMNIDSVNRKKDGVDYPVTIFENNEHAPAYSLDDFEDAGVVPAAAPERDETLASPAEWDGPTADVERITARCAWMRHCREDAASLSEPEWYASLSILGRCQDGERLAHAWSRPHPTYSWKETNSKLQHALEAAGPRTCADIEDSLGGDDYCGACPYRGRTASPIVLGLADQPTALVGSAAEPLVLETPPYPLLVMPEPVRSFVEEGARAKGVPPEFIAVHLLTLAGTALGRGVEIVVKPNSWVERPILWSAVIADPGSAKSPALTAAKTGILRLQDDANRAYAEAAEQHQDELAGWAATRPSLRRRKPAGPQMQHYYTTDATPEALAPMLQSSRGVAIVADELLGWVRGMDAYKSGRGKERQTHLELWSGGDLKIDRKGFPPMLVQHPVIGVVGGIQPQMLVALSGEISQPDGFLPRFLWSFPEPMTAYWTDDTISQKATAEIERLFEKLARLEGSVKFGADAKAVWVEWFNRNTDLVRSEVGLMVGVGSKMPSQLARIALILHCLRYPLGQTFELDADTLGVAIQIVEYHRAHARKTFACLGKGGSPSASGLSGRILDALDVSSDSSVSSGGLGERTTIRTLSSIWLSRTDLYRELGNSVRGDDLTRALKTLEGEGLVKRRTVNPGGGKGGRPCEEFRLATPEETEETSRQAG